MKPYIDCERVGDIWFREFDDSANEHELEWHRDKKDRLIEVVEGDGWMFQYDNDLPFLINSTNTLYIPKETFHRLHKGKNRLKIKIEEYADG
jgi:hypothetical protein